MNVEILPEWKNDPGANCLSQLVKIAMDDTGQSVTVRKFLLHLFNPKNPVDLVKLLCGCDAAITQKCFVVMKMRHDSAIEPHSYFVDGDNIFKSLHRLQRTV